MENYKARHKLRNWLVIIFFTIIIIIWLVWQKNIWQKNLTGQTSQPLIQSQEMSENLQDIKAKLKESYQQWQDAKAIFTNEINSAKTASSIQNATNTREINNEIIEKIKEKITNQTSTENLEN